MAIRVLIVGGFPPPIGGTTVLLQQLVDELSKHQDVDALVLNTSRESTSRRRNAWQALCTLVSLIRVIRKVDVVTFHSSVGGAALFGPIVALVCNVFRRPWVFRGFGGNFDSWFQETSSLQQHMFRRVLSSASLALFETTASVHYFRSVSSNPSRLRWYPNSRPSSSGKIGGANRHSAEPLRVVFIGHVKAAKGVKELLGAAKRLQGLCKIDVFGPLLESWTAEKINSGGARYRGVLDPAAVSRVLKGYDVLVLPTYYEGEGYPGVILEAYAVGVPVIATSWRSIPEIVTTASGILVSPKNIEELTAAIRRLTDRDHLAVLQRGAQEMGCRFDSKLWTRNFADACAQVAVHSARTKPPKN